MHLTEVDHRKSKQTYKKQKQQRRFKHYPVIGAKWRRVVLFVCLFSILLVIVHSVFHSSKDRAQMFLLTTSNLSEHHFETNTEYVLLCRLCTGQELTEEWLDAEKLF